MGHISEDRRLWRRWTLFCAIGEFVGMAAAFSLPSLAALGIMVLAGAAEGLAVGVCQWWALRERFPRITISGWVRVSVIAAAVGWLLGMLPSLFAGHSSTMEASFTAPPPMVQYLAAAVLGAILGSGFGAMQWTVLRHHTLQAKQWIVANALGWAIAMIVIFAGANSAPKETPVAELLLLGGFTGIIAGLCLGAITGTFLVRMKPSD